MSQKKKSLRRKKDSLGERKSNNKFRGEKSPLFFICILSVLNGIVFCQEHEKNLSEYVELKKRVYSFSKLDFITSEGEFNEAICTLLIPDLKEDSQPFVAIYYK